MNESSIAFIEWNPITGKNSLPPPLKDVLVVWDADPDGSDEDSTAHAYVDAAGQWHFSPCGEPVAIADAFSYWADPPETPKRGASEAGDDVPEPEIEIKTWIPVVLFAIGFLIFAMATGIITHVMEVRP